MSYNSELQNNNADLQKILDAINALPEPGVVLPELTNEGTASDLLSGKELIDDEGNIVTGTIPQNGTIHSTMDGINTKSVSIPAGYTSGGTVALDDTIDNEVDAQTALISQIAAALEGKGSASGSASYDTCTVRVSSDDDLDVYYLTVSNGVIMAAECVGKQDYVLECLCNSIVVITYNTLYYANTTGIHCIATPAYGVGIYRITAGKNETAHIVIQQTGASGGS